VSGRPPLPSPIPDVDWTASGERFNELGQALVEYLQPIADTMLAELRASAERMAAVQREAQRQREREDDQLDALRMACAFVSIPPPERVLDGPTVAERLGEAARRGLVYLSPEQLADATRRDVPWLDVEVVPNLLTGDGRDLWTSNRFEVFAEAPLVEVGRALSPATVERIMAGLERFAECDAAVGELRPPHEVLPELHGWSVIEYEEADGGAE
jgi:hypothetical protein